MVSAKNEYEVAKRFLQSHRSCYMPRFDEDPNIFEGMTVYWYEPKDDDDDDNHVA